jgi:bisphosphoglycerate-independent phosphoglycerate mutase (AlkP superfamily)
VDRNCTRRNGEALPRPKSRRIWLIEKTHEERTERAATREKASRIEEGAVDEAVEILRTVRADYQRPTPVLGDPDAKAFFVFRPDELRDLLKDLRASASG